MPPAVAIAGIGAAAGIGGGIISGNAAKSAANKAAAAQTAAAEQGIAEQRRQFDITSEEQRRQLEQTRTDLAPWQTAGTEALGVQSDILGLNGDQAQGGAIQDLQKSPMYQALFGNGENAILANASATGGLRGGNTQRSLANFGRDTLAQVIEAQLAKLGGVSSQGQNAAAQVGNFGANAVNAITNAGTNSANNVTQLLGDQGAARAGASLASGAATGSMVKDITGAITGLAGNSGVQSWVGKLF